jgi:23S rRNA pseudouridine2605 synthase
MARPRINKSKPTSSKGKGTSFGKKSEAEISFLKKKKASGRSDEFEEKRSFGSNPRSSGARFSKPGGFRSDNRDDARGERPFRKSSGPFDGPRKFDKPFSKDGDDKRPYGKTNSPPSFGSRPDKFRSRPFEEGSGEAKPRITKEDFKKVTKPAFDGDGTAPRKKDSSSYGRPFKKSFVQARVNSDTSFTKRQASEPKTDDGLTRLNKYIANSGVGSRRDADELIKMGLISVNGTVITELGSKVKQGDVVRYEDKVLKAEKPVYILLNKPKGFITTTDDPQERNTVMGLVAGACKGRIYPVGRLDRNTTGLLLLTNDGELADKLTHPSYKAKKVYKVELDKPLTKNDFVKIQEGVHLQEGKALVDDLAMLSDDSKTVGLEIHIGWNRVVRRIFESLGYEVLKLDRSVYAGLDKKDVGRGQWRFLKPEEVVRMKHFK